MSSREEPGELHDEWGEELADWLLTDPPMVRGGLTSRSHARLLRRFFLAKKDWFEDFHYTLLKAASTTSYDIYLTRVTLWALLVGGLGALVTGAVQLTRQAPGVPLWDPVAMLSVVRAPLLSVALPALLGGLLVGTVILWAGFSYPAMRAWSRERAIDALLPYGNVLLFSLAEGGLQMTHAVRTLANASGPFGELAHEFERVDREVALFGRDTQTALSRLRAKTPSGRLVDFLEELQAATEAGTSFRSFMAAQTERAIDEARRDQELLLELLTAFAQVYIVGAFIAPLFTLILLVLLSLVGGDTLPLVYVLVYGYSPLVIGVSLLGIHYLDVLTGVSTTLPVGGFDEDRLREAESPGGDVAKAYRRRRLLQSLAGRVAHPLRTLTDRPSVSLLLSIPAMIGVAGVCIQLGLLPTSTAGFAAQPTTATGVLAGLVLVPSVPYSVFEYLHRRRKDRLRTRFPELLRRLAEANAIGATFVDSCRLVVPRFQGPIREEFDRFVQEARLTGDVELAMIRLAERLRIDEIRIAAVVIIRSYRSAEDQGEVLEALADSLQQRFDIEADRARAMRLYTFVLLLGVTTFLAVVFFLNAFFFSELSGAIGVPETGAQVPFQPRAIDPQIYETVLFHSALIQGFGSGLLLGKLQTNRMASGLKYSNALVALSIVVFVFLL